MNRQGSMSIFSLLSFSQKIEGSLAYKFAGGWNDGMDQQATFKVDILPEGVHQRQAKLLNF
jgi:hypothetical protein